MELISNDSTDAQAYNNYAYSLVERDENIEFALELAKNAVRLNKICSVLRYNWLDLLKPFKLDKALFYIQNQLVLIQIMLQ